jgi:hypothetical protein
LALSALNSEQEVLGYDLIGSDNSHVTLWNVGSGRLERRFPGFDAAAAADGSVVQYVDPANKHIGIARRNQRPLGTAYISAGDFDETLSFDRSGKLLLWATDVDQGSTHIRILRTSDMAIIAERDFPTGRIHDSGLNSDGTALTILRYTPAGPEPVLWKFSGAQKRDEPVVLGRGTKFITMARDEKSGKIATLGKIDDGHSLLSVWDDRTGGLRSQQRINMTDKIGMIRFVGDGRLIVVQFGQAAASILFGNSKLSNPHVFNSDDLSASQRVTQAQDGVYIWGDYLAWRDGGTTKIWDTVEDRLTSADGLPLEANARAQISPDRHRVILSRKSSTPELWDAQAWKRIKLDLPAEPVTGTTFTIDGDGVLAQLMGGHYVLLDSVNGSTIQTFSDIQDVRLAYYRRECDLVRFWTSEGLVLEFTKGRKLPFVGFRPTKRCAMRH